MNAASLPLGHAPHLLVQRSVVDGTEIVVGRFATAEGAERMAVFCRGLSVEFSYRVTTETPVLPGLEGRV